MTSSDEIRQTLLEAARQAGPRYLRIRGSDLEAALMTEPTKTADAKPATKPQPPEKTK